MPWTESEHLAFLEGLRNLGKGNWCVPPRPPAPLHAGRGGTDASPFPSLPPPPTRRGIAQYYVPSRTPTQVASHAQKHYLRLNGATKRKSRFAALEEVRTPRPEFVRPNRKLTGTAPPRPP